MKKIFFILIMLSFNANAVNLSSPLNVAVLDAALEDNDKYENRSIYIYKTKKMNGSYNHTWLYDYKDKTYLKQKTCVNVKEKIIITAQYNIDKRSYQLCKEKFVNN